MPECSLLFSSLLFSSLLLTPVASALSWPDPPDSLSAQIAGADLAGEFLVVSTEIVYSDGVGKAEENWKAFMEIGMTVCQQQIYPPSGPAEVYQVVHTQSSANLVQTEWWLSAENNCTKDYIIGSSYDMAISDGSALLHPDPYDFRFVPMGLYYICAMIDPYDTFAETNELDNMVVSDGLLNVTGACP